VNEGEANSRIDLLSNATRDALHHRSAPFEWETASVWIAISAFILTKLRRRYDADIACIDFL
jgi:hypothetical protein